MAATAVAKKGERKITKFCSVGGVVRIDGYTRRDGNIIYFRVPFSENVRKRTGVLDLSHPNLVKNRHGAEQGVVILNPVATFDVEMDEAVIEALRNHPNCKGSPYFVGPITFFEDNAHEKVKRQAEEANLDAYASICYYNAENEGYLNDLAVLCGCYKLDRDFMAQKIAEVRRADPKLILNHFTYNPKNKILKFKLKSTSLNRAQILMARYVSNVIYVNRAKQLEFNNQVLGNTIDEVLAELAGIHKDLFPQIVAAHNQKMGIKPKASNKAEE